MTNYDKILIDRKFRNANGNNFRKLADEFSYELVHMLKNMPDDWTKEQRKSLYDEYMEKYKYIQEIARERFGEPRVCKFEEVNYDS